MIIARIVSSDSHVAYIGRVIDALDVEQPPSPESYGLGKFVGMQAGDIEIVGVICGSQLINPEYGNYGPRLSSSASLQIITPDVLNEQGVLVNILLLGTLSEETTFQGTPRVVLLPGTEIKALEHEEIRRFHRGPDGEFRLHYYPTVISNAGLLATPLLEILIDDLSEFCGPGEKGILELIKNDLLWKQAFASSRI